MEPTADGLVEVTSESLPSAPSINEVVASVSGNGHAAPATDGDAFNLHLLHALQSVRLGDFSARLPGDATGVDGKIADTFNEIVASNQRMAQQLEYVGQVVGREGKTRQRVKLTLTDIFELLDRKSTRLNSSHVEISYAVLCLKNKKVVARVHDGCLVDLHLGNGAMVEVPEARVGHPESVEHEVHTRHGRRLERGARALRIRHH